MYKFQRLRALLRALSVTRPSRRTVVRRWLWTLLRYLFAGGLVAAYLMRTPHDWPVTWRDMTTLDVTARSFLLSSYISLATGFYLVTVIAAASAFIFEVKHRRPAKMLPPPSMAPALRQAIRARDPHVTPIAQRDLSTWNAAQVGGVNLDTTLAVAVPDVLTRLLISPIAAFAGGVVPLLIAAIVASTILRNIATGGVASVYFTLAGIGALLLLAGYVFAFAGRLWHSWKAGSRGVEVDASAEGLIIRGPETRWRPRFIPWSDAQSFARATTFPHPCTIYLLDAGSQTLLWEAPPDPRHTTPSQREKIMRLQTNAARLVTIITAATALPLLDISEIVNEIAMVEPDPEDFTPPEVTDEGAVVFDISPNTKDTAIFERLISAGAAATNGGALASSPRPSIRLEQWRRLLDSVLVWFAVVACAIYSGFLPGMFHP